ncbi:MAG: twin-arginine translocase subunit TatC [Odoribacteraceae bacterium]|jgi:sec-independent protein translocase protein TatC|nr:twin-arginine translocase subunit TatC [Odoribacteraceae bacterium]
MNDVEMTFWDHLDELRKVLLRALVAVILLSLVAFACKETLFSILLAPREPDFILYRLLEQLAAGLSAPALRPGEFHFDLISTRLTSQFMIHVSTSFYAGLLLASPYVIYQLFRFIAPALHDHERAYSSRVLLFSFLLFFTGVLLCYFVIFPLSLRFLATYKVVDEIQLLFTLDSYANTFITLSLMLGLLFEIPVLSWLLAKLGMLSASHMTRYRRHAVVGILVVAAIITPTTDLFSLVLVSLPVYALYEASIVIVKRTGRNRYSGENGYIRDTN